MIRVLLALATLLLSVPALAQPGPVGGPAGRQIVRPGPAWYAVGTAPASSIAFNAAADLGNNGGTTNSLTASYTVGTGSNRMLYVTVAGDTAANDVTGVTYNGVAMTSLFAGFQGGNSLNRYIYSFFLLNPPSGSHSVVVSSSSNHYLLAGAADYTGVAQSGQPDAVTTNFSAPGAGSITTTLTTVAANSWIIASTPGFSGNPPVAGTGDIRRTYDTTYTTWGIFDSNGGITPPAATSMTMTVASSSPPLLCGMASFKP